MSGMLMRRGFVGGAIPKTYATWNPSATYGGAALSNGNRTITASGSAGVSRTTIRQGTHAAWSEHEIHSIGAGIWIGIANVNQAFQSANYPGDSANSWGICSNGQNYAGGQSVSSFQGVWSSDSYGGAISKVGIGFDPSGGGIACRFVDSAVGNFDISQNWPSAYPNNVPGEYYLVVRLGAGASITSYFGESTLPITGTGYIGVSGFYTP